MRASLILAGSASLLILGTWLVLDQAPARQTAGGLKIAATIFPLADLARQIGGPELNIVTLMPPGASPHTFEPSPSLIEDLQGSRLVLAIGHGLDDWSKKLLVNVPGAEYKIMDRNILLKGPLETTVVGTEEDEEGDGLDPHYWLDAQNGKIIAQNIAEELKRIDPTNAASYDKRLAETLDGLDTLDAKIKTLIQSKVQKNIVTHHEAWQYFAKAYGLNIVGIFEPSPGKELTPKQLAELEKIIVDNRLKTVFIEPQLSDQVVKPLASDLGVEIRTVNPEGGTEGYMTYQDLLWTNAQTFAQALN